MKLNQLSLIEDGIEAICKACQDDAVEEIIDALTGIMWSEEEASQIKKFIIDAKNERLFGKI